MADTRPAIENIENTWIDVYSALGIPDGVPIVLQNTGARTLILHISSTQPTTDDGRHLYPLRQVVLNTGNSGCWVKAYPKASGLSRLQVDITGGFDDTRVGSALFPDALNIQVSNSINSPDTTSYLLVTNATTNPITIDQVVNAEAFSTGNDEGTSLISMLFVMNPDLTGATLTNSDTRAYANSYDGTFADITDVGILFNVVENLDAGLNRDVLRIVGGQVTYFTSNQGLTSSSLNGTTLIARPFTISPAKSFMIAFSNAAIVDGGTEVFTTALISGSFLSITGQLEVLPDNLTYEGDNLTYESDNLTYRV